MEDTNTSFGVSHEVGDGTAPELRLPETALDAAGSEPFSGRSLVDPRRARVRRLGTISPTTASPTITLEEQT